MTSVNTAEGDAAWLKKRSSLFKNTPNTNTNGTDTNVEKKVVDKELTRLKSMGAVSSVWTNKFVKDDNPGAKRLSFNGNPTTTPKSPTFNSRARKTLSENNKDLAIKINTVLKDEQLSKSTPKSKEALATGKNNKEIKQAPSDIAPSKTTPADEILDKDQSLSEHSLENPNVDLGNENQALVEDTKEPLLPENDSLITSTSDIKPENDDEILPKETPSGTSTDLENNISLPKGIPTLKTDSDDIKQSSLNEAPASSQSEENAYSLPKDVTPKADLENSSQPSKESVSTPSSDNKGLMKNNTLPKKEGALNEEATEVNTEEVEPSLSIASKEPILEETKKFVSTENDLSKENLTEFTPSVDLEELKKSLLKGEITMPNINSDSLAKDISEIPGKDLDEAASLWFQYETLKTQNAQMNARLNKTRENIAFYKRQMESLEKNTQDNDLSENKEDNKRYSSGNALSMVLAANANLDEAASLWFQCETLKTQNARINARLSTANEDMEFYVRQLENLDSQHIPSPNPVVTLPIEKKDTIEAPLAIKESSDALGLKIELDEAASLWFQCETLKTQYAQINARFNKANEEIEFYKQQLKSLDISTREGLNAAAEEKNKEIARVRQLAELIVKQDVLMSEYEVSLESLSKSASQTNSPDPQIQALQQELVELYKKKDEMEGSILTLKAELEMAHSQMQLIMVVSTEIQNEFESYKYKMDYGIEGMLTEQQQRHEDEFKALEQKFTIMAAETRQKEIEEALGSHLNELEELKEHKIKTAEANEREIVSIRAAHAQQLEDLEKKLTEDATEAKEREISSARNIHLQELQALEKVLNDTASENKEREITNARNDHFQELKSLEKKLTEEAIEIKEKEIAHIRNCHLQELQALEKKLTEASIEVRKNEIEAVNTAHSRELEALTQKLMANVEETKQREIVSGSNLQELESLRMKVTELTKAIGEKETFNRATVNGSNSQEVGFLRKRVKELTSEIELKDKLNKAAADERESTLKVVLEQVTELKKLKEELCERERQSKMTVVDQSQDIAKIVMEQVNELKKIKQELCERERLSRSTLDEREIVSKIVLEQVIELKKLKDELCDQEKAIVASATDNANTIKALKDQVGQLNNTLEQKDQSILELKKQMEAQKTDMEAQIIELTQSISKKDAQLNEIRYSPKDKVSEANGFKNTSNQNNSQIPKKHNYSYTTSSDEDEMQNSKQFHSYENTKPSTVMYGSSDEEDKQENDVQRFSYSSFRSNSSATPSTESQKEQKHKRGSVGSTLSHTSAIRDDLYSNWPMPPPTPPPSESLNHEIKKEKSLIAAPVRRGRSQTMVLEEAPSLYTTSIHQSNELPRIVHSQTNTKPVDSAPVPPPRKDIKNPVFEPSLPSPSQNNEQKLNTKWMDDPESEEEEHFNEAQVV